MIHQLQRHFQASTRAQIPKTTVAPIQINLNQNHNISSNSEFIDHFRIPIQKMPKPHIMNSHTTDKKEQKEQNPSKN